MFDTRNWQPWPINAAVAAHETTLGVDPNRCFTENTLFIEKHWRDARRALGDTITTQLLRHRDVNGKRKTDGEAAGEESGGKGLLEAPAKLAGSHAKNLPENPRKMGVTGKSASECNVE